jgi:hypothetical protein
MTATFNKSCFIIDYLNIILDFPAFLITVETTVIDHCNRPVTPKYDIEPLPEAEFFKQSSFLYDIMHPIPLIIIFNR